MDNFTINIALFGLLGLALAWSDVGLLDKPINFIIIMVLVVLIHNTSR
jgi:hypothetical protein